MAPLTTTNSRKSSSCLKEGRRRPVRHRLVAGQQFVHVQAASLNRVQPQLRRISRQMLGEGVDEKQQNVTGRNSYWTRQFVAVFATRQSSENNAGHTYAGMSDIHAADLVIFVCGGNAQLCRKGNSCQCKRFYQLIEHHHDTAHRE